MAFSDDYLAWTQQKQKVNASTAAVLLDGVADTNPDQYAGAIELGKAFNVPADLANEGRDLFSAKVRRKRNELMLGTAPVLAGWLQNPENARVAHDDIESLSWFEGFARGVGNAAVAANASIEQIRAESLRERFVRASQADRMSFGELVNSDARKGPDGEAYPVLSDIVSGSVRWLDSRAGQLFGRGNQELAKYWTEQVDAFKSTYDTASMSQVAQEFSNDWLVNDASFSGAITNMSGAVVRNPIGALSFIFETAARSAPQLALGVGVTAATRNPVAGVAASRGATYATERYLSPAEFFKEKGLDFKNGADLERLLNEPELMKEAAERGVIRGAVVSLFDMASMGMAGQTLARNPAVEALAQTVQQAVLGASGEAVARKASGQEMDWNEVLAEGLAEMATTPVDMATAGHSMVVRRRKAKEAENVQAQMAELSQAAAGSKLKQRPGGKLQEWLSSAFGGTPKENVFVPAEVLATYFQANGIDPDTFFQDLSPESGKAFDLAVSTGGDVRIPTAAYTAKIVGSDLEPVLQEHVRFDPEGMTFAEAKAFNEGVDDALQDAFDEAERERDYEDGLRSVEDRVYDDVVMALRGAGREQTVARNEAMVWPAFYRAMAERSGYTPEEFLAKFPLPKIRGAIPEGMQVKDVDQFNRTLAEARSFKAPKESGSPFLEWLDRRGGVYDDGGELKARDAVKIKRQGKKTLRIAKAFDAAQGSMMGVGGRDERHTIEGVMQAAIAEGFFADDPIVQRYQEAVRTGQEVPDLSEAFYNAVDAELRGVPLRNVNDPANRADYFNELTDYLDRLGVSLDDADDVIKAAVAADQAANGQVLEQRRPEIIDPLQEPGGDWRNAELAAETEDGERVTVLAGEWMDLINDRIRAAEEVLACVRG